jgi:hypothetical protein
LAKVAVQCSADTFLVIKVWFSASTFVVKIATFAKPENVSGKPPYSEKELISKANVTSIRTPSHRLKFYYLDGVLCKADLRVGA